MTRPLALSLLVAVAACGGGQTGIGVFSTAWQDDQGESIESVRQRMAGVPVPLGADVAVGVAGHGARLVGLPLSGGARWTFAHAVDTRPVVAGGVVVASGAGELFTLDALTGRLLWSRPTGGLGLRGAGDDGAVTVVTMNQAVGQGSTLLAVSHEGAVLRQIERPVSFGAPAVVSHLAFVPWDRQYVSVLDITDGAEIGRVVLRDKTSHAWTTGGALYFGEQGLFRFDEGMKRASRGGAPHLSLPAEALPGRPLLMRPGNEVTRSLAGAADKMRLYARPTPPGTALALDEGRFYATYFRAALGLSADGAKLAWVRTYPSVFIGGAATIGGLALCDADGKVTFFDAAHGGQLGDALDLGEPLESCVVQVDGLRRAGSATDPGPLVQQIRAALADRDLELDTVQTLLLRDLAALPDEGVTELLVTLMTDARTPAPLREEARAALPRRTNGARFLIAALDRRYDFLHDALVPPPVGALAASLVAMNERGAAPLLARHLLDPATPDADVRAAAQALTVLATAAEVPALLRFFALYRDAPVETGEIPAAVNAIGEALLRVGGPQGRGAIDLALRDPSTNPAVRAKLQALLDAQSVQGSTPSTTPSSTSRE